MDIDFKPASGFYVLHEGFLIFWYGVENVSQLLKLAMSTLLFGPVGAIITLRQLILRALCLLQVIQGLILDKI